MGGTLLEPGTSAEPAAVTTMKPYWGAELVNGGLHAEANRAATAHARRRDIAVECSERSAVSSRVNAR